MGQQGQVCMAGTPLLSGPVVLVLPTDTRPCAYPLALVRT